MLRLGSIDFALEYYNTRAVLPYQIKALVKLRFFSHNVVPRSLGVYLTWTLHVGFGSGLTSFFTASSTLFKLW